MDELDESDVFDCSWCASRSVLDTKHNSITSRQSGQQHSHSARLGTTYYASRSVASLDGPLKSVQCQICWSPAGFWMDRWHYPQRKTCQPVKALAVLLCKHFFQPALLLDTWNRNVVRDQWYSQPLPYTGWSAWSFHSLSLRWRSEPPHSDIQVQLDRSNFAPCSVYRYLRLRIFTGPGFCWKYGWFCKIRHVPYLFHPEKKMVQLHKVQNSQASGYDVYGAYGMTGLTCLIVMDGLKQLVS